MCCLFAVFHTMDAEMNSSSNWFAEAKEFQTAYEKAMTTNADLLKDAAPAVDPKPDAGAAAELAEKIESVKVSES